MKRVIKDQQGKELLFNYIDTLDGTFTVNIKQGEESRSLKQNRLAFQWFKDASTQGDQTAEEYRTECKLHCGVPILRIEDESFREKYDRAVKPLDYESKLTIMEFFPVTSLMNVKQMTLFLDAVSKRFYGMGIQLTDPSLMGMNDWREWG